MTLGFWLGAAALVGLAWAMLWPALRPRDGQAEPVVAGASASLAGGDSGSGAGHLPVLQEQLAALDADRTAGRIDAVEHARARAEIERRALDDDASPAAAPTRPSGVGSRRSRLGVVTAVTIPLLASGLYGALGNRDALRPAPSAAAASDLSPEAVARLLVDMEKQLTAKTPEPADAEGWTLLARSYASLEQFEPARRAFDRAIALAPIDAQLLADQADVVAMLQGRRTAGEPARLAERALQLDPSNLKALALAGSVAFDARDFAAAARHWARARELAESGTDFAAGLERSLAEARAAEAQAAGGVLAPAPAAAPARPPTSPATVARAASAPGDPARPASPAVAGTAGAASTTGTVGATAATLAGIDGRVALAPALAGRVAPGDTVFVFARAVDGPRMPLAIVRRTVADLPFDFRLDDAMAMSPEMKLSKFDRVVVVARVSRTGSAMPSAGDLFGESTQIGPRAGGVQVTISGVQP